MYYMHIHRAFLFNKVLAIYNKKHRTLYSKHEVHVVYLLYLLGGNDKFTSFSKIMRTMQDCGIGRNKRNMETLMLKSIDNGLVMQDLGSNKRYWYKITISGMNFLVYFENRLRKERWNR